MIMQTSVQPLPSSKIECHTNYAFKFVGLEIKNTQKKSTLSISN